MFPIIRSKLVSVTLPVGISRGASIEFTDQPELNGTFITGIESITVDQLSVSPSRNPVVSLVEASDLVVTLNDGSDKRHDQVPYLSLNTAQNAGIWHEFKPFPVDWQKSAVSFMNTTPLASTVDAVFVVHYFRPEDIQR